VGLFVAVSLCQPGAAPRLGDCTESIRLAGREVSCGMNSFGGSGGGYKPFLQQHGNKRKKCINDKNAPQ